MCLPFFHKYKIVGGYYGENLVGTEMTVLERVCSVCGDYTTQTESGRLNIDRLVKNSEDIK